MHQTRLSMRWDGRALRTSLAAAGAYAGFCLVAVLASSSLPGSSSPAADDEEGTKVTAVSVVTAPDATVVGPADDRCVIDLAPGDRGLLVESLQVALAEAGFAPGPADGLYGAQTRQALVEFVSALPMVPGDAVADVRATGHVGDNLAAVLGVHC